MVLLGRRCRVGSVWLTGVFVTHLSIHVDTRYRTARYLANAVTIIIHERDIVIDE